MSKPDTLSVVENAVENQIVPSEDETSARSPSVPKSKTEEEGFFKKHKKLLIILLLLLLLLIMIIILIILFIPRYGPGRSQLDPYTEAPELNETESPTESPTLSPTLSPTESPTESPITLAPTQQITNPPTFQPLELSKCNCAEIKLNVSRIEGNFGDNNFKVEELASGDILCGDTFGGIDPERPNRNPWSVRIGRRDCPRYNYNDALAVCTSVGARFCTAEEFTNEIAYGTGCGGDREFVYTNTDCEDPDTGKPGKVMFDVGLRDNRQPFYFCEFNLERTSLARCCGDIYEREGEPQC